MLNFNTLFPIKSDAEICDLISIVNMWIIGSPHSCLSEEEIEKHRGSLEWEESIGAETLKFIQCDAQNYETVGIRYSKEDTKVRWVTDIIGSKSAVEFLISIQVSNDTTNIGDRVPRPKKPYIIKQLLEKIGGGDDGNLKVQDEPYLFKNSEIDFAANLMKGSIDLNLPVIYISSDRNNDPFVDAKKLAEWFSGMAHVVVEPNKEFSFRLMHEVSHHNAYGGAVGIYWPSNVASKILLPSVFGYDALRLEREVSNTLHIGLNAGRPPRKCTWSNLKELNARRRIEKLKDIGSTELKSYIANFDTELKSKTEETDDANREILRLKAELQLLNRYGGIAAGEPVLLQGPEKEFYANEYKDMLLLILKKAMIQSSDNSRRQHILADVLRANEIEYSVPERNASSIKTKLKNYKTMSTEIRRFLEELGFDVTEDGKHYKATFKGDNRYVVSISKTSSDRRAGKNIASDINKLLF